MADPTISDLYDFEGVVEAAVAAAFTAAGLVCLTPRTPGASDMQKARPRVEVVFMGGPGQKRLSAMTVGGCKMEIEYAWRGRLRVDVLTEIDIATHADYRAKVRAYAMSLKYRASLANHAIWAVWDAGVGMFDQQTEKNLMLTQLFYDLDFAANQTALSTVITNIAPS